MCRTIKIFYPEIDFPTRICVHGKSVKRRSVDRISSHIAVPRTDVGVGEHLGSFAAPKISRITCHRESLLVIVQLNHRRFGRTTTETKERERQHKGHL